jgi:hypothetical protein
MIIFEQIAKMKKIVIIGVFLFALVAVIGYFMWNKPKKSAASEDVFAVRNATELYQEFVHDPAGAFQIYNQKNIEVRGVMESFSQDSIGSKLVLKTNTEEAGVVTISFAETPAQFPIIGDSVYIRGLCAGFIEGMDLLGGEVQLNQGVIVSH